MLTKVLNGFAGQAQGSSDDVYPPQSSRGSEIEDFIELLRGVFREREAVYVSAPITSGQRFIDWVSGHRNSDCLAEKYQHEHARAVVTPNRLAAESLVKKARKANRGPVIDPTIVADLEGWTQGDYRTAWARIIQEYVRSVVFANGWQFSNGCAFEFVTATKASVETFDESWQPIDLAAGTSLVRGAVREVSSQGLPAEFLRGTLEDLKSLESPRAAGITQDLGADRRSFKDAVLDLLANYGNVAQFVSFSPRLEIRYSRVAGHSPNVTFASVPDAIEALLRAAPEGSVNVRSYHPDSPKSREFVYGLRSVQDISAAIQRLSDQGLYTIANETVDVNDGGVSGVVVGEVIEFAPGDTPRCVEKPGTVSLPRTVGLSMLQHVYGFAPALPTGRWRTEFSLHPIARGYRQGHTILWEAEPESASQHAAHVRWPNHFSRFLGDKAFGLLLANSFGFPVPSTVVVSRNVRPFAFGRSTGTGQTWTRTCPTEPVPGKFTTVRGWIDPFKLLLQEDPEGKYLASVISQDEVRATFSGASIANEQEVAIVEGVEGFGSDFMLGRQAAQALPPTTGAAIRSLMGNLVQAVGGTLKVEWAYDEGMVWILQMQQIEYPNIGMTVVPGDPTHFRRVHVSDGIERFRTAVDDAKASGEGIVVVGSVGITSHFGDILRRSGVPSRIEPPT